MDKLVTLVMYILWTLTLIGVLVITFTRFEYTDLNVIVGALFVLTIVNSYLVVKERK